ncbi:MAG: hypothetical protein M3O62_01110 [Pseudomonadota bacterium]|nr:hypothetical protein [Pseudomonadota bacterium]
MSTSYARKLFGTAALFNGLAGLSILGFGRQMATLFGFPAPENLLFSQITGMVVVLFGIGYAMEARHPGENRAAVVIGMYGKIGIVVLAAGHVIAGTVNWVFPALAGADLVYAFLFWRYLSSPGASL